MGNHCFISQFILVEIFILMQKLKQHCMCYTRLRLPALT